MTTQDTVLALLLTGAPVGKIQQITGASSQEINETAFSYSNSFYQPSFSNQRIVDFLWVGYSGDDVKSFGFDGPSVDGEISLIGTEFALTPTPTLSPGGSLLPGAAAPSVFPASFPNLLLDNDASFETSIGGWTENNGSTISRSTGTALVGSSSLEVAGTAAYQGAILKASNAVPVVPFQTYTGVVSVNPSATGTFEVGISYLDSTRTQIEFDQGVGLATVCQVGVWTELSVTSSRSSFQGNEAFAVLFVNQTGTDASTFNVDCAGIAPGLGTLWTPGKTSLTGSGAPVASAPAGTFYYRTDTPTTANQRIYVNTSAGSGTTWTGIV